MGEVKVFITVNVGSVVGTLEESPTTSVSSKTTKHN